MPTAMLEIKYDGSSEIYPVDKAGIDVDLCVNAEKRIISPFTRNELYFGLMDGQRVVVKKSPNLLHEWTGQEIAHKHGFNVPTPLVLAHNNQVMVSSLLPGEALTSSSDDSLRYQLGEMVRALHTMKQTDNWGKRGCNNYSFYDLAIHAWAITELKELAKDSKIHSILSVLAVSMIDYLPTAQAGFTHRDVHDEQALVADGSIGLIDFEHWGDNDVMREIGMYLFHKVRKSEPISGFEFFSRGALGSKMDAKTREVALYYLLFIAGNALKYFSEIQSAYLPTAFYNFNKALDFAESEQLMK